MLDGQIIRVSRKLAEMRRRRGGLFRRASVSPFGHDGHSFQALAPVANQHVAAFEDRHRISLPPDYRAFITQISGGGLGPAYGLVPFEESAGYERDDLPEDIVSRAFPFTAAHNPRHDPDLADFWRREGSGGLQPGEYEATQAQWVCGTIVLCHEGCGYLHLLVVAGAAYGTMWIDSTVSDGGYSPLNVGFLDWYERWLDDALAGGNGIWWHKRAAGSPTSGCS